MYSVVTDLFPVHIMVKYFVIFGIIRQAVYQAVELVIFVHIQILPFESIQFFQNVFQTVFGIEDCRLIHIVPESFHALVQQKLIFISKPFSHFFIQHIREQCFSGPYRCNKRRTVFFLTEVSFFQTFFVHIISFFLFYTGIDDRNQMDMFFFHFFVKCRKIREGLVIQGKVFVSFHIVDIQIHTIQRNVQFSVFFYDLTNFVCTHVTPATLTITKCPFWSNVAATNQTTELFYDIFDILTCNNIDIQIPVRCCDHQLF